MGLKYLVDSVILVASVNTFAIIHCQIAFDLNETLVGSTASMFA